MRFPKLNIPTASDVVVMHFEDLILQGILDPGADIPPERKLSELLGVSRTTLREALAKLQTKGLLIQAESGIQVHNVFYIMIQKPLDSLYDVNTDDLLEMWTEMICSASELAATRLTPQDVISLKTIYQEIEDAYNEKPSTIEISKIKALMNTIALTSYNFVLLQVIKFLNDLIFSSLDNNHLFKKQKTVINIIKALITSIEKRNSHRSFEKTKELCKLILSSENTNIVSQLPKAYKVKAKQGQSNKTKLIKTSYPQDTLIDLINRRPQALEAIFEFRIILERMTSYLAAKRRSQTHIQLMNEKLNSLEQTDKSKDLDPAIRDIEFHAAIASASGNEALQAIGHEMIAFFRRTTHGWLKKHDERLGSLSEIHQQHRKVLKAIKISDPDLARSAMEEHLDYVIKMLHTFRIADQRTKISALRLQS